MLGLMIEIIPSEIVLAYAGYLVFNGSISFIGAVVFGTIGGVIAQIFIYWLGRYGGRPILERYGKYIFIHKKQIDAAEDWFNRYGTGVIFTALLHSSSASCDFNSCWYYKNAITTFPLH